LDSPHLPDGDRDGDRAAVPDLHGGDRPDRRGAAQRGAAVGDRAPDGPGLGPGPLSPVERGEEAGRAEAERRYGEAMAAFVDPERFPEAAALFAAGAFAETGPARAHGAGLGGGSVGASRRCWRIRSRSWRPS